MNFICCCKVLIEPTISINLSNEILEELDDKLINEITHLLIT